MSSSFRQTIWADFQAAQICDTKARPSLLRCILRAWLFHPDAMCVFWYRVNRAIRHPMLALFVAACREQKYANHIAARADIGPGFHISHRSDIAIAARVRAGKNLHILNGVTIGRKHAKDAAVPTLGNNVTIYSGAKIVGDIRIGNDVIIGALSFVDCDVPDGTVMYGIPPNRVIRSHRSTEMKV